MTDGGDGDSHDDVGVDGSRDIVCRIKKQNKKQQFPYIRWLTLRRAERRALSDKKLFFNFLFKREKMIVSVIVTVITARLNVPLVEQEAKQGISWNQNQT